MTKMPRLAHSSINTSSTSKELKFWEGGREGGKEGGREGGEVSIILEGVGSEDWRKGGREGGREGVLACVESKNLDLWVRASGKPRKGGREGGREGVPRGQSLR